MGRSASGQSRDITLTMGWKNFSNVSSLCPLCSRSAYPAESYIAADRTPYHKACLKCGGCQKMLTSTSLNEHNKALYCQSCYQHQFLEMSDNGPADKRKMQVLPGKFGGQFDKDPLNLDDSEHRRKQAAVEATLKTMRDLAKQDAFSEQAKIRVKIQETVSL